MTLSEVVSKSVQPIAFILTKRKIYIVAVIVSFVFFFLMLFPYEDLSDKFTEIISEKTQNQVFIQSDKMGLGLLPTLSVVLTNVSVDTPSFPTLKAGQLTISPSLLNMLTFRFGFSASAKKFLDGDIDLKVNQGAKVPDGGIELNIDAEADDLNVKKLEALLNLPVKLMGTAGFELESTFDTNLTKEPKAEFSVNANEFTIPNQSVPTPFGPLLIPQFKFSKVQLAGRWVGSDIILEQAEIGERKDPVFIRLKYRSRVELRKYGNTYQPNFGPYTVAIDLNAQENSLKELGFLLGSFDKYKQRTNTGVRYLFQLSGSFGQPPKDSPVQDF